MTTHEVLTDIVEKIQRELNNVDGNIVNAKSLLEIIALSKQLEDESCEALKWLI